MANLDQIANHMADYTIVESGETDSWTWRKWADGTAECWKRFDLASSSYAANNGYKQLSFDFPSGLFIEKPPVILATGGIAGKAQSTVGFTNANNENSGQLYILNTDTSAVTNAAFAFVKVIGKWK